MEGKLSWKLNNKGSAIVTVLVITTFITVIGTTMLFITSQNYQQKQTDYQNKQSFYGAEKALDCLKAVLVNDAGDAYRIAYQDTMQNYARFETDKERRDYYQKSYTSRLVKLWDERKAASADGLLGAVKDYVAQSLAGESPSEDSLKSAKKIADCIYKVEGYGLSSDGKQFVIKGVRSKYTSDSYTTFLYTDICINVPEYGITLSTTTTTASSGETSSSSEAAATETSSAAVKESGDIVALTDYVVYMNWRRSDYDDTAVSGITFGEEKSTE